MNFFQKTIFKKLLFAAFLVTGVLANNANAQSWYNTGWLYRKPVTIASAKVVGGTLTNFPVLINITDAELKANAQSNGNDILFTTSDGVTKISHEIETYTSTTGGLVAWVEVPALASNSVIYMYYGNASAANQQDVTGTWDTNFKGVYHMNTTFADATSNNNDGTNYHTTATTGKISGGRKFVRSDGDGADYITIPGLMGKPANITLSAWATLTTRDNSGAQIINLGDNVGLDYDDNTASSPNGGLGFAYSGSTYNRTASNTHYAGTGWHYIVYTFNDAGNAQSIYVDGVQKATSTFASINYNTLGTNTIIGKNANGKPDFEFDGTIDEVRVSNSVRSAGWVTTEYNNQSAPSSFYSVGAQTFLINNNLLDYTNGSHGILGSAASENANATLTAPSGTVFTTVGFASYGNSTGTSPNFTMGTCNAVTSESVVQSYLLGNNTASIPATNIVFGDPCSGTVKKLNIQATYTQPVCSGSSPGTIAGTTPTGGNGAYVYYWEKSTTSSSAGFAAATGTNNTRDYISGALTQTTWYRRTVTSGGLTDVSPVIQVTVISAPSVSGVSTITCVGGSTGTITAAGSGGTTPYTYSLNSGAYQSSATFTGLAAGTYTVNVKSNAGCVGSASVTVGTYATSTDNQSTAGTDTWIGHVYDGISFNNYIGHYNKTETFNESNGLTCLALTSNSLPSYIYTETYSIKYRMNSTKKGLYVVDLGSDDGSRLTVDGTMVYNNWADNAFSAKPSVLISLNGASSLLYEFYNNALGSQVAFQNLTLVIANTLSTNTTQNICVGNTGTAISGDVFGTLPAGITAATYRWSYSTTPAGTRINISGATGPTFTPNTSIAPFNTLGTYYIYRNVTLTSTNNVSPTPYVAANESNVATIMVSAPPSATISYTGTPYCSSEGTASVTLTGTAGGTYSSATLGSALNAATGDITLASAPAGTHTVIYTISASGGCSAYTTTASITITTQPYVTGSYPGNPYCSNAGTAIPTGSASGAMGTFSSASGLLIDANYGTVNLGASTPGTYTVTYTVPASGGCLIYTSTKSITITAAPTATISYLGSPYCATGIATVYRTGTAGGTYSSTTGLLIDATTGAVNLATSTPGNYTVTYTVAAAGSCAAFTTTTSITIKPAGTWTGITSSNWNIPTNWECGVVPNRTTNVIIPTGTPFYPILTNITAAVNNLTLQSGATITLNSGNFKIAGLAATTGGKIMATAGKVTFNGTAAQTIPSRLFSSNTILDLVDSNTVKLTLGDTVRVTGTVGFDYVNNSELASNGFLILVSTNAKTANLTDVTNYGINTNNTVTGDVTVERYTQGRRAYRFLTAPVNSTTSIKANWMEGVNNTSPYQNNNPLPGYGTHITGSGGSANGFDMTSTNNPSLYSFNITGQAWTPAANTNGTYKAGNGFRIMVRGSRSVDLNDNNAAPSTTTLRAKGAVVTGAVTFTKTGGGGTANMPALTNVTNAYSLIANPYPSTVDWSQIALASDFTDLSPWIYVFDPTLGGSGARGVYVAYDGKNKKKSNLSSLIDNNLQSGQAFFLMTTGPNPSLTFREKYKVTNSLQIFRTTSDVPVMNVQLLLPEQVNTTGSADGAAVYFSDDYTNSIGTDDAFKFTNQDENLAILRNGQALSVEGRKPVSGSDSIPLKLWQLTSKNYTIKITLDKFADNVESYLQDKYLKTTTQLSNGETLVPFTITADAASAASDRFMVVFESFATLPVRLTGIKAYEKNKGVQVEWTAESESNMDLYEIQRSSDARDFTTIGSAKAKNNTSISTTYNGFDAKPLSGDNYYRIKSIEKSGDVKESEVVKVNISSGKNGVSVVNNPVNGKTIQLLFNNVEKGNYEVSLINIAGEKVYSGRISYTGGTLSQQIELKSYMAPGLYQLRLISGSTLKNVSVLIQ